jgi:hypothetical protein
VSIEFFQKEGVNNKRGVNAETFKVFVQDNKPPALTGIGTERL